MPLGRVNIEWLNHNSQRQLPLADDAAGVDQSGTFKIPDDFIVEMELAVHAGMDVDPARFFILNVGAFAGGYSIVIGYQPASGAPVQVANALIASHLHTKNKSYVLAGVEPFYDATGFIVIGSLDNIAEQPPGFQTFDFAQTRLDPFAIWPILRGLSSITVVNSGQRSAPLVGDIELVAGSNCLLVPIQIEGEDPMIQINAIKGEGTVDNCLCVGDDTALPAIQTINGQAATTNGEFTIVGDDCLQVVTTANGIQIVDKCSAPCCSCRDLETITRDLETLYSEKAAVQQFVDRLGTAVDTMAMTVLGARLSDRGCIVCE